MYLIVSVTGSQDTIHICDFDFIHRISYSIPIWNSVLDLVLANQIKTRSSTSLGEDLDGTNAGSCSGDLWLNQSATRLRNQRSDLYSFGTNGAYWGVPKCID
jgi:hypothetical protein